MMLQQEVDIGELLMHHTADAYALDFSPFFVWNYGKFIPDIHVLGLTINLTPSKHAIYMAFAAFLVFLTMWTAGRTLERQRAGEKAPKGFANAVESLALWVRNDVAIANIGHHGAQFAPYIMSLFFFLLYCNLLGLLPWGASPTANLAVTGGMAILSLFVIELSGIVKLGWRGYMKTIFPPAPGMGGAGAAAISVAMAPIEIIGKLVKPFALCVRLFGNMTAGHFAILALFGLIFLAGNLEVWRWGIGAASALVVFFVMALELIIAFVQAYVFTLITAVLIGVIVHEH
ncbi:MAG: F0F1 ATP synthase subunit A [Gemmatimonadota bacterium]|nr:F0F1 ATP synthase subunit A [Gemmatimonadota bacterium]MDH3367174.1 F0F1 ATP synthase subunit A [Gemmatimonadota bacterium]MDH3478034.1 F0F1 ATP synthase subunit A [Gemmatimonadota bacterium]MDH3569429.1 F0F1 ATP synthase subunit A [Gemmatimonadota bacterium]MDH5549506.1 F0F1 ATP synthase subunit A [Gemmatimonadota bacterium]